jgi:hypothetical protein
MAQGRKVYKVLVECLKEGYHLEDLSRRWENGIRMDLREIRWEGVEWVHLAEGRDWWQAVVSAMMNLQVLASRS